MDDLYSPTWETPNTPNPPAYSLHANEFIEEEHLGAVGGAPNTATRDRVLPGLPTHEATSRAQPPRPTYNEATSQAQPPRRTCPELRNVINDHI